MSKPIGFCTQGEKCVKFKGGSNEYNFYLKILSDHRVWAMGTFTRGWNENPFLFCAAFLKLIEHDFSHDTYASFVENFKGFHMVYSMSL